MPAPTIESRRRRRVLLMSPDPGVAAAVRDVLPAGWDLIEALDLDAVGDLADVLQLRLVLLDLDPAGEWDPIEVVATIRSDMMLNVPIICFGGDAAQRDQARLARADRFFERAEMATRLPGFCDQLGW